MRTLVVIPARSGSKGVPGKNVRHLGEKPLIEYSIDAALSANKLSCNDILVTSDCDAVAAICAVHDINFRRRATDLCADETPMLPVLLDALEYAESEGKDYTHVLLLQPTCPFRTAAHIDEAIGLASAASLSTTIVSVYQVSDTHPGRMYRLDGGQLMPLQPKLVGINRQDLPPVFHRNGAIYLIPKSVLRANRIYGDVILPMLMTEDESLNIDSHRDWVLAEALL